ncbi:MAG: transporter substrate-binding domain-containing protein [Rhodospirillales bacterium]|nr:transporter substrate-binding domain-containing protein [Rhodospirillales bacterium]
MTRSKAFCRAAVLAWACMFVAAAPTPSEAQQQPPTSRLDQILQRGKLLAGVRFDFPPAGYVDKDGKNVGFGVDIAREFAKRMGVEIEFVQSKAATRIPLIQNGNIDVEFGSTAPTKPRDEVVDFSMSYIWDRSVVVVPEGQSKKPEDYYNTDKRIGAIQGADFARLWVERSPKANMKYYQEYPELLIALAQGHVDMALTAEITAIELIESLGPRAKGITVGQPYMSDPAAIVLPENDSKWRDFINWGLQRLWADGTFQTLYKQHFKIDPPFHPWENGQLQPRVMEIGDPKRDPWKK